MMHASLAIAFTSLASLLAGCAADTTGAPDTSAPDTTDTPTEPTSPVEVPGPETRADGFASTTPAERKRLLEAALGVDADRAVIRMESLRGSVCPLAAPVDGGIVLHGPCNQGGHRVSGQVTIVRTGDVTTYTFEQFDIQVSSIHERFDGKVTFRDEAGRPSLHADHLTVTRSIERGDEDDRIHVTSTGTWTNDGRGRVYSFSITPTHPDAETFVGAAGIGTFRVSASLNLATQAGGILFDGGRALAATSIGNGACWNLTGATSFEPACDLDSLIVLDPRLDVGTQAAPNR